MILDTNALSAFIDGDSKVISAVSRLDEVAIPVIVAGEYRFGIAQSPHKSRMGHSFEEFLESCSILNIDVTTTRHYAAIRLDLKRAGTPITAHDVWVAALSRQHSMPVMSRDKHFDRVTGLKRKGW